MEPEFQRALLIVAVVGTVIFVTGGALLFLFFRGFGGAKAGGRKHIALMVGMIAFIFACCGALFIYSLIFDR
ncbi:MAG TPA: hypothetical protein VFN10_03795 [Thermoanaerobaculia bacterium]|nr:hypothetical protein [Thermoanaerobaculia bacterium]